MARVVAAQNEGITIQIDLPPPQAGVSKFTFTHTFTVQIEPAENQTRRDSVPVQETEPPAELTDPRHGSVIIY